MNRQTIHRAAEGLLPPALLSRMLTVWRRYYWWRATRINPARGRATVRKLIAAGAPIRLEIGSGPRGLVGWTSLDLNVAAEIRHDLTGPLPFPDSSVEEIYSSHVFEHFTYPHPLLNVVRECHRVLKPDGRLRVAVPNARVFLEAYFEPKKFDRERFCTEDVGLSYRNRMDVVNFIAHLGGDHKYLFDEENLLDLLGEAGFRAPRARHFDADVDRSERRHESIYVEAVK